MNTEKLKTYILCALVISGLILTSFLWYGDYPYYEDAEPVFQEVFFFEEPRSECGIVTPQKIVLPLEQENFAVFRRGEEGFHFIWDSLLEQLGNGSFEEQPAIYTPEEKPDILLYFKPDIFPEMIFASGERERDSYSRGKLFIQNDEEIYIFFESTDNRGLLIKFNGESTGAALANITAEVLNKGYTVFSLLKDSESLRENDEDNEDGEAEEADAVVGEEQRSEDDSAGGDDSEADSEIIDYRVEKDIYLPDEELMVSSLLKFDEEEFSREDLLKAIFVDKELARRIAEPDGTLIFTDGERGLRISESVEYTAPGLEGGAVTYTYRSALNKANEYICFYGGWADTLFLREIDKIGMAMGGNESFRGIWSYYVEGFPVLGERGTTEVRFNDQGLFYYRRSLLVPDFSPEAARVAAAPGEEALREALDIYRNDSAREDGLVYIINDLFPAYIIDASEKADEAAAYFVWVVQVEEKKIFLDAVNLKQVFPGDNDEYF